MRNRIKVERAEIDLTQEQLASRIGVSRQTINSIEKNRYVPSTILALKLSEVFGKSVNEIFFLEPEIPNGLKGYIGEDGRFNHLPGKRQKNRLNLMLDYLITQFEFNKKYSEKEVNNLLDRFHSFNDPASLRRFLFGRGLLDRTLDGSSYWRKPQ